MNILVTGAFQLNSGEREQLEAAGHKVFVHGEIRWGMQRYGFCGNERKTPLSLSSACSFSLPMSIVLSFVAG